MTDAIAAQSFSPAQVLQSAARATGADFDFLLRTAARESNFDPAARARTSSAAGMFQFIEQTWLAMMARHGADHGQAELASEITEDSSGRFQVADPARRQQILDLRFDPDLSGRMAGELSRENASIIRDRIGREPETGELYAAHFLGARSAARLIETANVNPELRADSLFPAAASANRRIFFDGSRARSAREVLDVLTQAPNSTPVPPANRTYTPVSRETTSSAGPEFTGSGGGSWGGRGSHGMPGGMVLSPAIVEILASLDAPRTGRERA